MSKPQLLTIGIVGFGARQPSVDKIYALSRHSNVSQLHIIWSQATPEIKQSLTELQGGNPKVQITHSDVNLGSAGGYSKLIESFRDHQISEFLLLLDDDLHLEHDCIEQLLMTAAANISALDHTLLLAYRSGLPELASLVTKNISIRRPRPGCCVGFHFLNFFKPCHEPIQRNQETGLFSIGSAPWGGLMIPRQALPKLGIPREDFFLYAEDYELTARFVWSGGLILLIPNAVIQDTDIAWNAVGGNVTGLKRRLLYLSEIKVFHEVRNRNFMARHYYAGLFPIYLVNKFIFLAATYALGFLHGKWARSRLIHRAINDGELMASSGLPPGYSWQR